MNTSVNSMVVSLSFFQWTVLIVLIVATGMGFLGAIYYGIKAGFESITIRIIQLAAELKDADDLAYKAYKKSVHCHDRVDTLTGERTVHQHFRREDVE